MSGQRKKGTPPGGRKASAGAASRPGSGSRSPSKGKGKGRGKAQQPLGRRIAKWVGITALVGFLLGLAAFAYGYAATDIPDPNEDFQTQTTMVYYADGKTELGRFAEQNRTMVSLADVPDQPRCDELALFVRGTGTVDPNDGGTRVAIEGGDAVLLVPADSIAVLPTLHAAAQPLYVVAAWAGKPT